MKVKEQEARGHEGEGKGTALDLSSLQDFAMVI